MTHSHSKISKASAGINQKIADLLTLVSGATSLSLVQAKSLSKLYELVVLEDILRSYKHSGSGRTIHAVNAVPGLLNFAGAPAKARKGVHSYFQLAKGGIVEHEAWVSVEVTTLGWEISGNPLPLPLPAKHEIDVGIFSALGSGSHYPSHLELHAAYSCKDRRVSKENVREVLGLRRETAYLDRPRWSKVEWLYGLVPATPASPVILASSNPSVRGYSLPLEQFGVYMKFIPFPA